MTRMKDSGIEWIGEVPEEWGITKLKYICRMQSGNNLTSLEISSENDGGKIFPVYGGNGQRGYYSDFTNEGNYCLVGRQGALAGNVHFVSGKFWATDHAIVVYEHTHTYSKYLCYLLKAMNLNQYAFETSAQPGLSVEKILQLEMIHCPKGEQTQIADFLDKKVAQLDEVKSLLEEQIKTLEDYRRSLIYETVTKGLDKTVSLKDSGVDWIGQIPEGWRTGKIKYYAEISAGSTPDRTNELFWNGDIPWMASGEVNQGVVTHTAEKITKLGLRNTSTKLLSKGTVMLALNGQGKTKGTAAILNIETASNQSLASFDVNNEVVNGYYLYYYFVSNYSNIRGLKGEDRDGLNLKLVSNIEIPLPNIDEQLKIADFLDKKTEQINHMIAIKKEQIENINKQRQTLIYDYVTGKRRV